MAGSSIRPKAGATSRERGDEQLRQKAPLEFYASGPNRNFALSGTAQDARPFFRNNSPPGMFVRGKRRWRLQTDQTKLSPAGFCGLISRCGVTPVPGSLHWASKLVGRHSAESPSRRADERASARKTSPPRPHRPEDRSRYPKRMQCSDPCSALRLLSSPAHSRAWPFAVARATQVCRRTRNQTGSS